MNFYLNSNDTLFKLYYLFINDSTITIGYQNLYLYDVIIYLQITKDVVSLLLYKLYDTIIK